MSLENELEVYRQLISACDTLLKNYPTTALDDQTGARPRARWLHSVLHRFAPATIIVSSEINVVRLRGAACSNPSCVGHVAIQNATQFAALSERKQTALVTRFSEKRVREP